MTEARTIETRSSSRSEAPIGRLFVLEVNAGLIHTMNTDGSDKKTIVTGCRLPDGIAVDVAAGHIYWTNMGSSPAVNDGSIERADIDGKNRKMIVPPGESSKSYLTRRKASRPCRLVLQAESSC